jgi:hypothetical protein
VLDKLERVRETLVNRRAAVCNVTLDAENWDAFQPQLLAFLDQLPNSPARPATWTPTLGREPEGLTLPAQVNYVAQGGDMYELGYEGHGSAAVITHYLNATYLWERIRVQGGAYGAFCSFNHHSGGFLFGSYRDPNLLATLDVYRGTADFLRGLDLSEDELIKAIIGAIGNIDGYQLPDAKGYSALKRHLVNYDDDMRRVFRQQVLGTTAENFHAFGGTLAELNGASTAVVLGSSDALAAANAETEGMFVIHQVL